MSRFSGRHFALECLCKKSEKLIRPSSTVKATGKDWTQPPYEVMTMTHPFIPKHFPRNAGCMGSSVGFLVCFTLASEHLARSSVKHLWISITFTRENIKMNSPQPNFTRKNEDTPPGSSNKFSTTQPLARNEGTGSLCTVTGISQSDIPAISIQSCQGLRVRRYAAKGVWDEEGSKNGNSDQIQNMT